MSIENAREFFAQVEYKFYHAVVNCGFHDAAEKQAEIMDAYATEQNRQLIERVKELVEREDAVFAKGYRKGYFDGSGFTAFNSEVQLELEAWDKGGRKTHLDIEATVEVTP